MKHIIVVERTQANIGLFCGIKLCFIKPDINYTTTISTCIVYEDWPELGNKLYEPMHYKIGVTCVYHGHVFYTLL